MALKLLRAVWFLSMVAALGALLYVYASLPQDVVVQQEESVKVSITNEVFFYVVMIFMAITNVTVYIISKVFNRQEDLRIWFFGLITTLNIFFIIGMNFISLYNSSEKFEYSRIAFVIYGSVGLIVIWAVSWPVYLVFKRINSKPLILFG
jgi:hypothetical protein